MKRMPLILALFLFSGLTFAKQDARLCNVPQTSTVSNMAPLRSQGPVGFCYAFSAIQLLDQFRCKNKMGGCKFGMWTPAENGPGMLPSMTEMPKETDFKGAFGLAAIIPQNYNQMVAQLPDDRLSVLDAIATSKKGALEDGGHANLVLEAIQKQGFLALEKCVPYEGILTSDSKLIQENMLSKSNLSADSLETVSWRDRLYSLFEELQTLKANSIQLQGQQFLLNSCTKEIAIAGKMKETANLSSSIEQILAAFHHSEFEEFLKHALIPKSCEANRVGLDPFIVSSARPSTDIQIKSTIESVLATDTPLSISICANTFKKLRSKNPNPCAGHAVVISGKRTQCCQDVCKTQYQVVDSAMMFWSESVQDIDPFDAWVDADEIAERIMHRDNSYKAKNKEQPTITWISKK